MGVSQEGERSISGRREYGFWIDLYVLQTPDIKKTETIGTKKLLTST